MSTETYDGELSLGSTSSSKSRTSETFWCSCDRCVCLPTESECICCHEVPQAHHIVDKFSPVPDNNDCDYQQKCVTFHQDFDAHLNAGVLDTYFRSHSNNWRRFPKPKGPGGTLINAQYRLVAYRFILDWLLQGEMLGRKKRIPLPACIVNVIRTKYPADDGEYVGFKYADLPTV
ncbi:hypothetical protein SNE40_014277 [Patella caerulea]|uniref:P2X purinoreceptor 7 intracellular domain-containing protein n=1 Tax=Patella caerulea TaxID=87958 RepID=A0AAN8PQ88_PATCE